MIQRKKQMKSSMKSCSSFLIRPLCFLTFIGISCFLISKLWLLTKKIEHRATFQSSELLNKSLSEIENTARFLLPLDSSSSNLARALSSSLNGTELSSFQDIQAQVAPTLFLALSTIPHLSQVCYTGVDGLVFSYCNDEHQTLAVFSNISHSQTWYTQPVNRDTGQLYGEAISSKYTRTVNASRFQNALTRGTAYSSTGTGWNKAQELLFLNTVAMDGRGLISIGFPAQMVIGHFASIDFQGGDFHLATNDGQVLVETKLPDTQIVVDNGTIWLHTAQPNGLVKDLNHSCRSHDGGARHFSARIGGDKHDFYCSTLEIAGVQSVYVLAFSTKGLEGLVHQKSKLARTLLVLLFVVVVASLCIFFILIVRAARCSMFLCAALIRQMEATQQAERKSMNKSLAFSSASHDVRASLAAITGLIELCQEEATPNSEMATNLLQLKTCSMDLVGILDSVLDMGKIEAGKMQLKEEEFNLVQLLDDVADMHYPVGMKKDVDVVLDPCDGSIFRLYLVKGDRGKLKQILCNLLSNAVKFTSEGHVSLRALAKKPSKESAIIASSRFGVLNCLSRLCDKNNASFSELDGLQAVGQNPNYMEFEFEVDDTGKGIPKDKQKSVFENFVQVKETALGQGGCGLGLGIVQSLVRLMGGEIKIVDKEPGERGTCFKFNIFLAPCNPAVSTENEDQEDYSDIHSTANAFHQHFGLHRRSPATRLEASHVVLLISGDERRRISKKSIENLGIKVSVAKRGRELFGILERIERKMELSQSSPSEYGLKLRDYLTNSRSSSSNDVSPPRTGRDANSDHPTIIPHFKKSNSRSSPSFLLVVIDAWAGPHRELCSIVAKFKKDFQSFPCKFVWLDNPVLRARQPPDGTKPSSTTTPPPCDHVLSKPFHGSRLYRVLGFLPEFGGVNQCISPRSTDETNQETRGSGISSAQSTEQPAQLKGKQKEDEKGREMMMPPLKGKKVLVVDDVQLLRYLATTCLKKLGASVDACKNGQEAFDQVCKVLGDQRKEGRSQVLPYDYIFMDIEMNVMNGYEATKLIRTEEKHYGIRIPIVALTAHAMPEEASNMISAGMDFHLTKPLQEVKLLEAIQSIEMNRKQ